MRGNPTLLGSARAWPTPRATDCFTPDTPDPTTGKTKRGTGLDLGAATAMWGTPTARDDQKTPEAHRAMKQRLLGRKDTAAITSLTVQVKDWPTPTAHDAKGQEHENTNLHNAATSGPQAETTTPDGSDTSPKVDLNPRFVEALMGVPPGWLTPCTPVETDLYQQWQQAHFLSSHDASTST
jgi:hypothetical protein